MDKETLSELIRFLEYLNTRYNTLEKDLLEKDLLEQEDDLLLEINKLRLSSIANYEDRLLQIACTLFLPTGKDEVLDNPRTCKCCSE